MKNCRVVKQHSLITLTLLAAIMAHIPIGQKQRQANMAGIIQFVGLGPAIPIGWFVTYKLIHKQKKRIKVTWI